ncbi:VanZ family protein [Butyrivibrio sp. WCE2006]|uniref:VanZ family protein n=1 Tax=Butyrivibrio sp. WCE2006 TaxID=1410611 RepID=UPI0005D19441|nr:VanZ family protein [Butyrivibrio sp. WCE2006]
MFEEIILRMEHLLIEQMEGIYLSDLLIIVLVCALFIFVPGYVLNKKKVVSFKRVIHFYLTIVYVAVLLLFTVFRRDFGSRSGYIYSGITVGVSRRGRIYSINQMIYCFYNVLLFVPWGFLLSFFRNKEPMIKTVIMTMLLGFLSSFSIEIVQHITRTGFFEVTDLVMNTAGSALGAFIGYLFFTVLRKEKA